MATVVRPGITRLRDASDVVAPAGAADDDKVWSYDHDTGKSTLVPQSQGVTDHAALSNLSYAASGHTGFEPAGAGDAAVAAHVALSDPHTQYLLESQYTAADVFAKVLTLDGSGSGLDADLLDGQSSAAFAASGHTHAAAGSNTQVIYNASGVEAGDAGLTYNAASDALTVAGRVVTPVIRPAADSATAVQVQTTGGTAVLTVDTTNKRAGIVVAPVDYSLLYVRDTLSSSVLAAMTFHPTAVNALLSANASSNYGSFAIRGGNFEATTQSASSVNYTYGFGALIGGNFSAIHNGSGVATTVYGGYFTAGKGGLSGQITTAIAGFFQTTSIASGIVNDYGVLVDVAGVSGRATNAYGIYIDDVTAGGTANYAIYTNGGDIRLMASNSDKIGFHGVTPVTRQLLATGAGATVDQVITALQNLGLLRQS